MPATSSPDSAIVPDVQEQPAGPAGPPPQTRPDRSPPDHRVRRRRDQPPDRDPDRLDDPQVRPHRPPLPHHSDPGRPPLPTRFLTTFARPSKRSPRQLTNALV